MSNEFIQEAHKIKRNVIKKTVLNKVIITCVVVFCPDYLWLRTSSLAAEGRSQDQPHYEEP